MLPSAAIVSADLNIIQAANLTKYITNYNKHCPKTKIVLVGYSEGSVIVMNTLCGASQAPWKPTAPINPRFADTGTTQHLLSFTT